MNDREELTRLAAAVVADGLAEEDRETTLGEIALHGSESDDLDRVLRLGIDEYHAALSEGLMQLVSEAYLRHAQEEATGD